MNPFSWIMIWFRPVRIEDVPVEEASCGCETRGNMTLLCTMHATGRTREAS